MKHILAFLIFFISINRTFSQVETSKTGIWAMYFYNHKFNESQWGLQGDIQYRDWQSFNDLEQLLIRSGVTYNPKGTNVTLTLGLAHITSGVYGDSDDTSQESRIYQEALLPQKVGHRLYFNHRFRYEQRFVEDQDFRTRFRYNLFLNIPINSTEFLPKTYYAAFYNELFINGERQIGDGRTVEFFDRNRTYLGLGYVLNPTIRFQLGWMNQKTDSFGKGQWQISMHHNF